jgi:hypothetical protein
MAEIKQLAWRIGQNEHWTPDHGAREKVRGPVDRV